MKKHITPGTTAALCLLTAVATANVTLLASNRSFNAAMPEYAAQQKLYGKLSELQHVIDERYVGEYDPQKALDTAATGFVLGVGDKWSYYVSKEDYAAYKLRLDGEMVGIGTQVTMSDGTIRIFEVYPDSPAAKAGLVAGDVIVGADDKTVGKQYTAAEVVDAVRGKAGTTLTLQVRHADGSEQTYSIKRATVKRTAIRSRMLDGNVGYIAISDFDGGADTEFLNALDTLQKQDAEGFIFDVRFNGGGSVDVLSKMLDPLLPEGPIISLRDKTGEETVLKSDANALDLPMAVLVNDQSISAAEFFPAALQEYGKAVIVGDHTTGKGYSQRSYELSDGSAIILSDRTYYTPKGKNLAGIGIKPDVLVSLSEENYKNFFGMQSSEDTQLQAAYKAVKEGK